MATAKKSIKPKATQKRETGAKKKTASAKAPSRSVKPQPAAKKPKAKAKAAPAKAKAKPAPAPAKAKAKPAPAKKPPAKKPIVKKPAAKKPVAKKTPVPTKPAKKPAAPAAATVKKPIIKKPVNTTPPPVPAPTPAPAPKPAPKASSAASKKPRFSKSDLEHFKTELITMRERITGQSGSMRSAALQRNDEMNPEEDGTDAFMRLQTLEQVGTQQREVANIDEALRSIEQGAYGICEMCGELISKPRLTVLPFATNCIKCQSEMEKASRSRR